jgi:hypothetical protein
VKRALAAAGALLAAIVIPGAGVAVVIVGLVAAWKYVTHRENKVTDATLRRIRAAEEQDMRSREMDDARVIPQRTVMNGPPPVASTLTKPWSDS